jgi:hypothetical protein
MVIEATARRWQRYGKDRLYVTARDGANLGWQDLTSGEVHVAQADRANLLFQTVAVWRERNGFAQPVPQLVPAPVTGDVEGVQPSTSQVWTLEDLALNPPGTGPQTRLLELEAQAEEEARGPQRRWAAEVALLRDRKRQLRSAGAVATFLMALVGRRTPEQAALRGEIRNARRQLRAAHRLAKRRLRELALERRPWSVGLQGEVAIGQMLAALVQRDARWRVLHSIPIGRSGADVDHLVIGPTGVYSLNTKHHPGGNLFVAHDAVLVNGTRYPYVRNSRHEAKAVSRALSSACQRPVHVDGLVVAVGLRRMTVRAQPADVVVLSSRRLTRWLTAGPDRLAPSEIERIFDAARRSSTWRRS